MYILNHAIFLNVCIYLIDGSAIFQISCGVVGYEWVCDTFIYVSCIVETWMYAVWGYVCGGFV